jgi:hypothetical protein
MARPVVDARPSYVLRVFGGALSVALKRGGMKMRLKIAGVLCLTLAGLGSAHAQVAVGGYYRNNGTYVEPHHRSAPNSSAYDNYSTKGNVNPYTGKAGSESPYGGSSYGLYGSGKRCSGYSC